MANRAPNYTHTFAFTNVDVGLAFHSHSAPKTKHGIRINRFAGLAHAMVPFAATNGWSQHSQTLRRWKAGSTLEVAIGSGAGQEQSRFSVSLNDFAKECRDAGFNPAFLSKLIGKRSMFEHDLGLGPTGDSPSSLELAMSMYENDAFTLLLSLDLEKRVGRALVFLKLGGSLPDTDAPLSLDHFVEWLQRNEAALKRDPLLVANCVLTFYQYRSYSYVNWRKDLYDMEARLGVTERADGLKQTGYDSVSFDYDKLNVDLAWLSRRAAETSLSVSTVLHQATALLRIVEMLESFKSAPAKPSITTEEIRSTILRAELFLKNATMVDDLVESMRAVLYNRITKHDSNSMKTIAVATLFFLPATFVSSVFSTGVFNFHASEGDQPQTISRWAWVYLLVCLLLTAVTLLLWLFWYFWGRLWLEKIRLTSVYTDKEAQKRQTINERQLRRFKGKDVEKGDGATPSGRVDTGGIDNEEDDDANSATLLDTGEDDIDSCGLAERLISVLEEDHKAESEEINSVAQIPCPMILSTIWQAPNTLTKTDKEQGSGSQEREQ